MLSTNENYLFQHYLQLYLQQNPLNMAFLCLSIRCFLKILIHSPQGKTGNKEKTIMKPD